MERRQDIVLGAVFTALGIAAAWMATSYSGAGGLYPMVLGVILTLLGAVVAARAIRSGADKERVLIGAPVKMVTAIAAGALYVALVVPLGFYTASFLLMLFLPIALGFRQGLYALIVAVVFMGLVYLVFSVLLEKPLPREALVSLFGTGG
ncbi:MAG: tripartite tricarboxylate transporter TctB family protein [Rhodobacteraceae bacterium]|nr:tripartite tricarboxylate transporter TctB family protein [Paracoccaceae bacterium]